MAFFSPFLAIMQSCKSLHLIGFGVNFSVDILYRKKSDLVSTFFPGKLHAKLENEED